MKIFSKIIKVTKDDLDELNHVNNVNYVQWIQDIAKAHWYKKASENIIQNYFWVVVSHFIEYKSSAFLDDEIRLETHVSKSEGYKSTRIVEMYNNKTNKLLVKSETNWCFMDATNKRPTRITTEVISLFN